MRFSIPNSPETGKRAIGTVDTLRAVVLFSDPDADELEYCGQTSVNWDAPKGTTDDQDRVLLTCGGSDWWSEVIDGEVEPGQQPASELAGMSAHSAVLSISGDEGWTDHTALMVALDFIDTHASREAFHAFLDERRLTDSDDDAED